MSIRNVFRRLANLPAASRSVNSLAALLLLAHAGSGCLIHPARTVQRIPPGEWLATLGSAERAPFRTEPAPETAPRRVWEQGVERGQVAAPVVHGGVVILGSTGRVLSVLSAENGRAYWHRRFNGPVAGSVLRTGDTLFAATSSQDGRVYAFTLARGRKLWQRRLHAPVVGEPVYHAGRLYAGTNQGLLYALDAASGEVLWRRRTAGPVLGAPVPFEGSLLLATARDSLVRLNLQTGAIEAAVALSGTPTATAALHGTRLWLPVHPNRVAAYDARTLALLREDSLDSPILASPVVAEDGSVYLLTRDAAVWHAQDAGVRRLASLDGAARGSLTLARNGLLVGLLDGTLVLLRRDGSEAWRQGYQGSIRAPVTLAGGAAFVALLNGKLLKLQ